MTPDRMDRMTHDRRPHSDQASLSARGQTRSARITSGKEPRSQAYHTAGNSARSARLRAGCHVSRSRCTLRMCVTGAPSSAGTSRLAVRCHGQRRVLSLQHVVLIAAATSHHFEIDHP
jgi:hypothetical protein